MCGLFSVFYFVSFVSCIFMLCLITGSYQSIVMYNSDSPIKQSQDITCLTAHKMWEKSYAFGCLQRLMFWGKLLMHCNLSVSVCVCVSLSVCRSVTHTSTHLYTSSDHLCQRLFSVSGQHAQVYQISSSC